jgi:DNA-directed RNA polymerase specialized sigma24 family protein
VQARRQLRQRRGAAAVLARLSTGDVVQEVFLDVLQHLEHWHGDDEAAFLRLLATLVEHRLVDEVRRHHAARRDARRDGGAGPTTLGVGVDRTPSVSAEQREAVHLYRDVLDTFAGREQALLALRIEDELEFAELAVRLAYPSADAARKAFHAAHARLLVRLRERGLRSDGGES